MGHFGAERIARLFRQPRAEIYAPGARRLRVAARPCRQSCAACLRAAGEGEGTRQRTSLLPVDVRNANSFGFSAFGPPLKTQKRGVSAFCTAFQRSNRRVKRRPTPCSTATLPPRSGSTAVLGSFVAHGQPHHATTQPVRRPSPREGPTPSPEGRVLCLHRTLGGG